MKGGVWKSCVCVKAPSGRKQLWLAWMYRCSAPGKKLDPIGSDDVQKISVKSCICGPAPSLILLYPRILVLKFVNKRVFFEEIQESHFPRKRGYFRTHLHEGGEKRVIFYVQSFTVESGVHLCWQVSFIAKKWVHFGLKRQCFIVKNGLFWAEKPVFCRQKGGHFQTGEQGWVPFFPVSEGAGICGRYWCKHLPTLTLFIYGTKYDRNRLVTHSEKGSMGSSSKGANIMVN